jgi:hypothetical protein
MNMDMLELVIKIPEEDYIKISNSNPSYADDFNLYYAIKNGTPLPKGHGRLIDADELKTLSYEVLVDTNNPNRADGLSACNGLVEEDIDLAPTIIEADKESDK